MPGQMSTPADEKDVLLAFYDENAAQARHHERMRQAIASVGALATALVLGLVAARPGGPCSLPCLVAGLFLAVLGAFGFGASLHHLERSRLHVERVHVVRREIARRFPVDIPALYEEATRQHEKRYEWLSRRTARVPWLWQGLHAAIAGLGLTLALAALRCLAG
jgi:hypothetical protein